MDDVIQERRWFWITLVLSSISIVGFVFALWELIESHFFRDVDYLTLHYLYISRGIVSSFLLAFWAAWYVLRQRRSAEQSLRRSRERYRGLLECSPGAVALYDHRLVVSEWNATAELLYGFNKDEVLGKQLPTITEAEKVVWQSRLAGVLIGDPVVDIETRRQTKAGYSIDVQLNVLPFNEDSGQVSFLEVSNDIRERVRLRQMLLQVEKLTAMGQMAAGTAHHLNTPLSSMLLRVQLARKHAARTGLELDLTDLENHVRQCQQFVRRLLDFSRRPQPAKQPESLNSTLEAVTTLVTPQVAAKHAHLTVNTATLNGCKVLADRNQLEAVFLIILSNALDAVRPGGTVAIDCEHLGADRIVIRVDDNGCGIEPEVLPHLFEPFFTTKPIGKGTGLGLAIASSILQEHGGSIQIQSTPAKGTCVSVELPVWKETSRTMGANI